ncbi:MAG: hypothetical protein DRI86_02555 [Bacteroidetes bacterium]|nr:MAG: hypothetical protein DRI86_02555 [Bacteroidota bacterium]
MKKISAIALLLILFLVKVSGQSVFDNRDTLNYPYYLWNDVVIENTNTAKDETYLTNEEKNIIWLCNLARFDGKLFSKTFLKEYIEKNQVRYTPYVKSLFSDLKKTKKVILFNPDKRIYGLAEEHAVWSGKRGKTGHKKFQERAKRSKHSRFAENAQYGDFMAEDIVMDLLIDEGIQTVGHRKNILSPLYRFIGVSIQPHKVYKYNCVMDFGG